MRLRSVCGRAEVWGREASPYKAEWNGMELTTAESLLVRSLGLYVTEKCDGCAKLLNQTIRYTITNKPEVYCSAECRDRAFFGDQHRARKHSSPGKCAYCCAPLKGKRRGTLYCDEICKKRFARKHQPIATAKDRNKRDSELMK
jgi:hypothetical protein